MFSISFFGAFHHFVIVNVTAILCVKVCDADFELAQTVHTMKIKATVVSICLFIYLFMICLHIYLFMVYSISNDAATNSKPIVLSGKTNNEFQGA